MDRRPGRGGVLFVGSLYEGHRARGYEPPLRSERDVSCRSGGDLALLSSGVLDAIPRAVAFHRKSFEGGWLHPPNARFRRRRAGCAAWAVGGTSLLRNELSREVGVRGSRNEVAAG